MTTIAWDGESLACDSMAITGGVIDQYPTKKIFKKRDVYYLLAGDYAQSLAVMDWLVDGKEKPEFPKPDYEVIAIQGSGGKCYSGELYPYSIKPPFAVGSGSEFAYGAMLSGKTAKEAVETAIKLDPNSGGKVRTYKI